MRRLNLALCASLFWAAGLYAAPAFSLRDVLSAPLPYELAASPKGDAFGWVMDAEGVRNIWIARAPAFTPERVTLFSADDGQELGDLAWLPDLSGIVFTRGSSPNSRGEIPNPGHDAMGAHQEIWIAAIPGTSGKLGEGQSPVISPDGDTVAWTRNGQIWSADLRGPRIAIQRTQARGAATNPVWSPDSKQLAFVSDRGDHSVIGIYRFSDRSLRYVDAGADLDQAPVWSPDSSQLALIRVPGSRYAFAWGPKRSGQPWSIRIVNLADETVREVWRAKEGPGSVFWPLSNSRSQLMWGADNHIIFPWEGDGSLHLYSIPAAGGTAALLTPGDFEVESASLAPDGKSVVISSNQNDIDRRHLWRANPAGSAGGSALTQLTNGQGIEARPVALADDRAAFVHCAAQTPCEVAILNNGTVRDLTADQIPANFPRSLVAPQAVEMTAADGQRIHGQLFVPSGSTAAKHPAMIFLHGGSRRQMLLGWHPMSYYAQTYAFNQYLAAEGYVVLSVNYRSGTGYGEQFREALNYGATGASEYSDVLAAANFLKSRADVDAACMGLWGGSYGGYLTALGLARNSDLFAAGFDLHGVHEWSTEIASANYAPAYEPAERQKFIDTAFHSSPVASMDTWKSPVFLVQGDDDRNVQFNQMVLLEEQLRLHNIHYEDLVFPDEVHEFLMHAHWLAAYEAGDRFLAKYLKP